jgi:hypothetical protein
MDHVLLVLQLVLALQDFHRHHQYRLHRLGPSYLELRVHRQLQFLLLVLDFRWVRMVQLVQVLLLVLLDLVVLDVVAQQRLVDCL